MMLSNAKNVGLTLAAALALVLSATASSPHAVDLRGEWVSDKNTIITVTVVSRGTFKGTYPGGHITLAINGDGTLTATNNLGNIWKGTLSDENTIKFEPTGGGAAYPHTWKRK